MKNINENNAIAKQEYPFGEELSPVLHDTLKRMEQGKVGAYLEVESLEAAAQLNQTNPSVYESYRSAIKKLGGRAGELDKGIKLYLPEKETEEREQVTDALLRLADEHCDLFHAADETAYAAIRGVEITTTERIHGRGFKQWLRQTYYAETKKSVNGEAINSVIATLEARARFEGDLRKVFTRVGERDGNLYLDLCNARNQVVEISPNSWQVLDHSPIHFERLVGMLPLPVPQQGGDINLLREHINVPDDHGFILIVSTLLAALRPAGPYPILAVVGEYGSAKSTFIKRWRDLVDPNSAAARSLPKEERDLYIAAKGSHVLAYDNLSGLPAWLSDALCRISTGAAFATRALFTNGDETLFEAQKPIIANGIDDFVGRPDLADRAVVIALKRILQGYRLTEQDLNQAFEADYPFILGALLDAMVHGLQRLPHIQLDELPRMADFAKWATACETANWHEGAFMEAFNSNRAEAADKLIESDSMATAVLDFSRNLVPPFTWAGTPTHLLETLNNKRSDAEYRDRSWPKASNILSRRLRRIVPILSQKGIEVSFEKSGKRYIAIDANKLHESSSVFNDNSRTSELAFGNDEKALEEG
jgi:hypothetical protein